LAECDLLTCTEADQSQLQSETTAEKVAENCTKQVYLVDVYPNICMVYIQILGGGCHIGEGREQLFFSAYMHYALGLKNYASLKLSL
jgi:hypothetical protein